MSARPTRRKFSSGRAPKKLKLGLKPDDPIDYKDLDLLRKCVGSQGQMFSRRRTGLTAKQQRRLKEAIKRARHLALMTFVG
ncbi:MAG: 30S ribosomal protein S18 [Planctomycetota bacterium]